MAHAHASRPLPNFLPIAREQVWFFITSLLRVWPFMILPLVGGITIVKLAGPHPDWRPFMSLLLALSVAAVFWPQQKTAGGISYFRSLPPAHWKNASARTGVAWVILMALCLTSFLAIDSGYRGSVPFWISAPALVSASFAFLVFSGVFAATRYGILWIIAAHWMVSLGGRIGGSGMAETFQPLITGRLGLMLAMTGRVGEPFADGTGNALSIEPKAWLLASAIWLTVGVTIFLFAVSRRREF